jgi:hypothetical protein
VQVAYTLVAQGHIGQNQLTGVSKVYPLGSVAVPAISGTATFFKRVNGEALAVVQCKTLQMVIHTQVTFMPIQLKVVGLFSFKPVTGGTGLSVTNISKLDNGTALVMTNY